MIEVLVVDGDPMVARVHSDFVDRTPGYAVTGRAHTAAQAVTETQRLEPDLVLLDVHLPDRSGHDVLADLRDAAPELDVLVTSQAIPDPEGRAVPGGAVHHLAKPFSYDDLQHELATYTQSYAGMGGKHADEADPMHGHRGAHAARVLPTGFSPEALQLVGDALRAEREDISAAELARLLALSRVSARRYLDHLVETGSADVRERRGEVDHPEQRYRWR
jgi:response regulator of citrate/malate metabolism